METYIRDLFRYNTWANGRMCRHLPETLADVEVKSSFPSLRLTLYHVWDAQQVWLRRIQGVTVSAWPSKSFTGTWAEACRLFVEHSETFAAFVEQLDAGFLQREIRYTNMRGDEMRNTGGEVLLHVCNHSTFHRGQLVTMLRELGVTDLPSTDLIVYYRERPFPTTTS